MKGISVILKSTVTKHTCTVENISTLLAFASNLHNLEKYTFTPSYYSHYKTVEHFSEIKPSLDQIMDIKDLIENLKPNLPFPVHIDDGGVTDGSECANNEVFRRNNICSGNMDSIVILPDGKVTICEELYYDNTFLKTALSIAFFILSVLGLSAQNLAKITGKITDDKGQPITLASVSLRHTSNDSIVAGTTTDATGIFSLTAEAVSAAVLKVEHIVFEPEIFSIHQLKDTAMNITLFPKTHLLGEITVTASRPQYRIKDDGNMVVAVEKVPGFETNNVFDLMRKLPGVITDDQSISLNGKDVEVRVDGRSMSYMNVLALLKSLPAHSLDEIELIAVKGAEHDGASQAIINLITKQQRLDGYFGNAMAGGRLYSNDSYLDVGNVFLMLKAKKVAFSTTFGYEDYKVKGAGEDDTYMGNTGKTIVNKGSMQDKERHLSSNSTFSWNIREGQSLFANLSLFGGQLDRKEISDYLNNLKNTGVYTLTNRDASNLLVSGNVEYRLGTLLKVSYGYVRGKSNYDEDIENTYRTDSIVPILHDENNLESQHAGKMDFLKKYNKLTVKVGLKGTFAQQENTSFYRADVPISYQDMDFTANENILSGYIELAYKISNKINTTLGFRSEHTSYTLVNREIAASGRPDYWNFFPSGYITLRPLTWYMVMPYFISGVTRPKYQNLLPGKRYLNDYNYTEGNPNLQPTLYYTIGMDHTFMQFILVHLAVTNRKNLINQVKIDEGNGVSANTYMNAVDSKTLNISTTLPFKLLKNKLNGNINFSWQTGQYTNARNNFTFPAQKNKPESLKLTGFFNYQLTPIIALTANVNYSAINKSLQTEYDPYATLDLGVNMKLLKSKQLSISLDVADIFDSKENRYKTYYGNNLFISNRALPSQYVGLVIAYRFNGGKKFNPKIDAEENDIKRFTRQ